MVGQEPPSSSIGFANLAKRYEYERQGCPLKVSLDMMANPARANTKECSDLTGPDLSMPSARSVRLLVAIVPMTSAVEGNWQETQLWANNRNTTSRRQKRSVDQPRRGRGYPTIELEVIWPPCTV
jgi:hypothetical protein